MNLMSVWTNKIAREAPGEPSGGAPADPTPAPAAAPDYSFLPAEFLVDGKPDAERFTAHLADLTERAKPRTPEDGVYDLTLPADLKFDVEGFTPQLDLENEAFKPLVSELTETLKSLGAPKEAGSQVLGLLARYQAAQFSAAVKEQEAQFAALGPQADARIQTVARSIETLVPKEEAEALMATVTSAKGLIALERLLSAKGMNSALPNPAAAEADPYADRYPSTASKR